MTNNQATDDAEGTPDSASAMASLYCGPKFSQWSRPAAGLYPWEFAVLALCALQRTSRILNVGCGAGRETFALHQLGYSDVSGLDCSLALVDVARQRAAQAGLPLPFVVGSAEALPFPAESFDLVTLFENVLGHITPAAARRRVLREVHRVLRPGGYASVEVTSIRNRRRYWLWIRLLDFVRRWYNPAALEPGDKPTRDARQIPDLSAQQIPRTHWFHPAELPADAAAAGLDVLRTSTQKGIVANAYADVRHYHRGGRLLYLLRK